MGDLFRVVPATDASDMVNAAWEAGVRHFDTAPDYGLGLSEERLGAALAERPRDEFIVTTKVGRLVVDASAPRGEKCRGGRFVPKNRVRVLDYSRDGVLRSIEDSIARSALDRADIVLVDDPGEHYREAMEGAFPALDELRADGAIRSYGARATHAALLANFIRNTDLDVVMATGCYSLLDQTALDELLPLALERQVSVISAGTLSSGDPALALGTAALRSRSHPASDETIARAGRIAEICEAHRVAFPVAAAQFVLGHPAIATVCLGARSRAHVERNASLFQRTVPDGLWADLVSGGYLDARAPIPQYV